MGSVSHSTQVGSFQVGSFPGSVRSGRGPHGNLRNFGAMGDAKFQRVMAQVLAEGNDLDAMYAVQRWARMRDEARNGFIPEGVTEEEWMLLKKLAGK